MNNDFEQLIKRGDIFYETYPELKNIYLIELYLLMDNTSSRYIFKNSTENVKDFLEISRNIKNNNFDSIKKELKDDYLLIYDKYDAKIILLSKENLETKRNSSNENIISLVYRALNNAFDLNLLY